MRFWMWTCRPAGGSSSSYSPPSSLVAFAALDEDEDEDELVDQEDLSAIVRGRAPSRHGRRPFSKHLQAGAAGNGMREGEPINDRRRTDLSLSSRPGSAEEAPDVPSA